RRTEGRVELLLAALGVVVLLAQLGQPDCGPGAVVVAAALVLVTLAVLRSLLRLAADGSSSGRRAFLTRAAVVGIGVVGAGGVVRYLQKRADVSAVRDAVQLPVPVRRAPGDLAAADLGVDGVSDVLTKNADFYRIDTALTVPQVDPTGWSLQVGGLVDRPYALTYADLLALPQVESDITMQCVSNEIGGDLVGTARFQGVLLRDVLMKAGVQRGAEQVVGESVDGFTAGFPVSFALDGRAAMIAVAMNGEPLPVAHGFPARLVVPGLYGYVSATKWLSKIEMTTRDVLGYWVPRGWSQDGPVKTMSRIDVPRGDADVRPGPVVVAGVAWAPGKGRGVARVEVRVDEGPWQSADLGGALSEDTWRQWRWTWDATPGVHVLEARAVDRRGDVQTGEVADVAPDGATGYHRLELLVRD
ncbi:MAG: hypothetical protein JWM64_2387, partial [Frankiales bacterium]|nr:hypothetical protein [Frankiales bacterium]